MERERRYAQRIAFETAAVIHHDHDQRVSAAVETKNISHKGVFLQPAQSLPLHTACTVEIQINGATSTLHFSIRGIVSRIAPEGMAIAFTDINADSYAHITNLINISSRTKEGTSPS